ncbi:Aldehyde dehydrogenase [Acetobacter malorum]|nr:Aldehyde dehydrogenase [Acetobacter malorum]
MTNIKTLFDRQSAYFNSGKTRSLSWRLDQLARLERMLVENETAFHDALARDFKTSWFERAMEFHGVLGAIEHTRAELADWMEPEVAPLPKRMQENDFKGFIYREPYGVCLVIAPFNAPVVLTLEPVLAALSAGNTALIKPAESTVHMTALFERLISQYFEPESLVVVTGGRDVMTELLALPFNFIFFTGSTEVGKIVMRAAAENLTPVLLELGGQNPVVVDETANLEDAALKIVWGTMAFGGQWCVSPGYVYVHENVADQFVAECKKAITTLYGDNPKESADLSRLISSRDVDRLARMLEGAAVVSGGHFDRDERYFEPTLVYPAQWSAPIMQSEIFGPILPILPYTNFNEVMETIKQKPRSLAAYIFSKNEARIEKFMHGFSFGGGSVNQTMIHCFMAATFPFGGVGPSGLGRYYGKWGFDSLSHVKSVLVSPPDHRIEAVLPPYTKEKATELGSWLM